MQRDECIYNLIPRVIPDAQKRKMYVSKYDPKVKPTGSTFGCQGKTRMEGSNLGAPRRIEPKLKASSLGTVVSRPNPRDYTKKGTGLKNNSVDPQKKPHKFVYPGAKKTALIKTDDRPVMGLTSSKDYVTANAVESILAVPGHRARAIPQALKYTKKVDYGIVPAYLTDVKREIGRENAMIDDFVRENQKLHTEEEGALEEMDQAEKEELINALKAKWDHVNKQYQKMGHNVVFDTQGKVRRKETFEKQLSTIEKNIELLEGKQVVISRN